MKEHEMSKEEVLKGIAKEIRHQIPLSDKQKKHILNMEKEHLKNVYRINIGTLPKTAPEFVLEMLGRACYSVPRYADKINAKFRQCLNSNEKLVKLHETLFFPAKEYFACKSDEQKFKIWKEYNTGCQTFFELPNEPATLMWYERFMDTVRDNKPTGEYGDLDYCQDVAGMIEDAEKSFIGRGQIMI